MNIFKFLLKNKQMKQLQIDETKAKNLYYTASPEFKSMLEDSFGKKFFYKDITDRVKTLQDACEEIGINYLEFLQSIKDLLEDEQNYKKLKVITKALNEGWIPDMKNTSEYKYFPYFEIKDSGFRFDGSFCHTWRVYSPGRLAFKSEKLAIYSGNQFINYYEKYLAL